MGFSRQEYWSGVPLSTPAMDMNLGKLQEMVWDRKAWYVAVHGVAKSWTWLGNWSTATKIFHCMYVSHLLYPFLCRWMLRLLPYLGYCEYCCYEYRDTCIFFNQLKPRSGIARLYQSVSSVAQSCLTFCDPTDFSTPGFPIHHQLPKLTHTHVHLVSDAIQPSHPLSTPSPPAFNHF